MCVVWKKKCRRQKQLSPVKAKSKSDSLSSAETPATQHQTSPPATAAAAAAAVSEEPVSSAVHQSDSQQPASDSRLETLVTSSAGDQSSTHSLYSSDRRPPTPYPVRQLSPVTQQQSSAFPLHSPNHPPAAVTVSSQSPVSHCPTTARSFYSTNTDLSTVHGGLPLPFQSCLTNYRQLLPGFTDSMLRPPPSHLPALSTVSTSASSSQGYLGSGYVSWPDVVKGDQTRLCLSVFLLT